MNVLILQSFLSVLFMMTTAQKPHVLIGYNNDLAPQPDREEYLPFGVENEMVSIQACYLAANDQDRRFDTYSEFGACTEDFLDVFIQGHVDSGMIGIDSNFCGQIILDIEGLFHPEGWYLLNSQDQADVFRGFIRRIAVIKRIFPKAALSLYGTPVLNATGVNAGEVVAGLKAAVVAGVFDQVDYLIPVLYLRNGPDDPGCTTEALLKTRIETYVIRSIDACVEVIQSEETGAHLGVIPLMYFNMVLNGNSLNHRELIDYAYSRHIIETLERYVDSGEISCFAFWGGANYTSWEAAGHPSVSLFFDAVRPNDAFLHK